MERENILKMLGFSDAFLLELIDHPDDSRATLGGPFVGEGVLEYEVTEISGDHIIDHSNSNYIHDAIIA